MAKAMLAFCALLVFGCSSGQGVAGGNVADAGDDGGGLPGDGGAPGSGTNPSSATKADGSPFIDVVDSYSSAKQCSMAGCAGTDIWLTDSAGTCPGHPEDRKHTIYIHLYNDPAHSSAPVTEPGTFTVWNAISGVGKQPSANVATFYYEIAGESNPRPGFNGVVTVNHINGDVYQGTFDVQDRDGQHIKGVFNPRSCSF